MDYVIKNNKKVFIRLDKNGMPVPCSERDKALFEYSKAKNIMEHIPKTMKKMRFKVEAVPEIKPKEEKKVNGISDDSISREEYIPSDNITRWVEKFGTCDDIISEAKSREEQLLEELKISDSELLDILHIIEIEKPKDMFGAWRLYKKIKDNRKKRRTIKDELLIIEDVLENVSNISCFHREKIQKAINGLFTRKYTFRVIEEDEKNEVMQSL